MTAGTAGRGRSGLMPSRGLAARYTLYLEQCPRRVRGSGAVFRTARSTEAFAR